MAEFSTVYLSSSFNDLKSHREAVYKALNELTGVKVIAMEDYVARDDRPLAACLKDVGACDIYVGLFAWRYGFVPPLAENPEQRSITELELAAAHKKPRLLFVLKADAPWPPPMMDSVTGDNERGERIGALRKRLLDERLATEFADPVSLAKSVSNAVSNHLRTPSGRQPPQRLQREVTHALYLAHHPADAELAATLARELVVGFERPVRLSAEALFARDEPTVSAREEYVIACHAAAALITPQSLPALLADDAETSLALGVLRGRTGALALLLSGVDDKQVPAHWRADARFVLPPADTAAATDADIDTDTDPFSPARAWLAARQPPPGCRSVGIPICAVAMTIDELTDLETNPALLARLTVGDQQQYAALKLALEHDGIDWQHRYGHSRRSWRPFRADGCSIGKITEDIADEVGRRGAVRQRQCHVRLQWYPFDALTGNDARLRPVYRAMARAGCMVLVDEISLFHPRLRETFQNSPFFNNDQVAIVTISPFDPGRERIEALLEDVARRRLAGAFDRYAIEYDPQCELAVGDERRLKRWLHANLPATLARLQTPQPDRGALGALAAELGEPALPPKRDYPWGGGGRT
ncbi:MAG: DUF4062 domain-containing protein [Azoarcus sp.]|nr:DUF4062 domain-containing protein [Azoarcus sp.]